jgi:hypothetical protein
MSDPFEDLFTNGASASGLEVYENHPILLIPHDFKEGGFEDAKGDKKDIVDPDIVTFIDPDNPEKEDAVRVFAGRLVVSLKKGAIFNDANPQGDSETGLPRMTIGTLKKGAKSPGKNQPWLLEPITDDKLKGKMAAYARKNLAAKNPFGED